MNENIYPQKKDEKLWLSKICYNSLLMKYKKIIDLLDNTTHQPIKFRTKNSVEIRGARNV